MNADRIGLEGEFSESELPLLGRRAGMAEWDDGVVRILDRRALPLSEKYVECSTTEEVAIAIEEMVIQGAFTLAIAAGYGLALSCSDGPDVLKDIQSAAARLGNTANYIESCLFPFSVCGGGSGGGGDGGGGGGGGGGGRVYVV